MGVGYCCGNINARNTLILKSVFFSCYERGRNDAPTPWWILRFQDPPKFNFQRAYTLVLKWCPQVFTYEGLLSGIR